MSKAKWNDVARELANEIGEHLFEAHRGATHSADYIETFVVFGNDGYSEDERSKKEVEFLRSFVEKDDALHWLGFSTAEDGYSWVALIEHEAVDLINIENAVWAAWGRACDPEHDDTAVSGYEFVQRSIAHSAIARYCPIL